MNVDPLAEQATNWTPYRYGYSNPVNFIDPTGMLETQYKDEDGQTLLNTKDGSDDVVTVSNDKRKDFRDYNASYQSGNKSLYDSQEWNDNMKADLLGFSTINEMNATLGGFTTQWSRQNAINYLQNSTLANAMAMSVSESLSQWTDIYKLTAAVSIWVGGISPGRISTNGPINVTEDLIISTLKGSDMMTIQGKVSLPMVQRYVRMLEEGNVAPPIKVANRVVIEGNHRYVAGKIYGKLPAQVPGNLPPSQSSRVVPMSQTQEDKIDWGGY